VTSDFGPVLGGLRVLEIGHYVAAPFCTRLLADLGADVIKVEPFAGDPVRTWGAQKDGRSLWWSMHGRNKRSLAIDLKSAGAGRLILDLLSQCDAVVENFRPGYLEKIGLGAAAMRAANAKLVIAHISGHGQDGPYRDRAAFGVIGEAMGGLRFLTNHAPGVSDLPPVRVGVSIGDSLAGLYAAFGLMAALWQRDRVSGDGKPRSLDVALTDSVLSMMEGMLPEFGALGRIKQPMGGAIATAAPSNAYRTADDVWVLIAANSDPLFARLTTLMKRPELLDAPEFRDNPSRVKNALALDTVITDWSLGFDSESLLDMLTESDIPGCKVFDAADCANDPQYRHRGMVREIEDPLLGRVLHAGVVPLVLESPGAVRWAGPEIGQHTDEVLSEVLGLDTEKLHRLRIAGVIK
jgi:crotonobetainyl-CoA:carnitine CoA-transferase CaiB-like acyl-CoA transferase